MIITKQDEELLRELKQKHDNCKLCRGSDALCDSYLPIRLEMGKINSNIPSHYRQMTFKSIDEPKLKKAIGAIKAYIDLAKFYKNSGKGLYIHGASGTAKTSVGCILLMELIKKGYSTYYTDLNDYLESQFKSYEEDNRELYDTLQEKDFVLLDNMGREYQDSKGVKKAMIEELIRSRTDKGLPIIMISNLSEDELMQANARVRSLLKEHFLPPIHFNCKDYREKIRQENETDKK